MGEHPEVLIRIFIRKENQMNNNVLKSVFFAAVVLVAGIVAMQVVYNNVTGSEADGLAAIAPAAGEAIDAAGEAASGAIEATTEAANNAADAAERSDWRSDGQSERNGF